MQIRFVIPVILLVASSVSHAQSAPAGKTPEQLAAELKWLKPGDVGRDFLRPAEIQNATGLRSITGRAAVLPRHS